MRKALLLSGVALFFGALVVGQTKPAVPQPASPPRPTQASTSVVTNSTTTASTVAAQRALLDQYCVTCHSDRVKRANLTLEKLDLTTAGDHAELWEKVIRKLRAGVMPPPGMRRPALKEYEGLRDWLENEMDRKAAARG